MNEYLLKELTGLVELTKTGIVKAVEVLQVEAPELIKQIMAWEFTASLISFLALILFLFAVGKGISTIVNTCIEGYKEKDCLSAKAVFKNIRWGIYMFVSFVFMIGVTSNYKIFTWIKILVAPKLFLIEYFTKLIK